jgi:hypothetical protein
MAHGKKVVLLFMFMLVLAVSSYAQNWSGLLDPQRAIDWSHAGAGAIPPRSTICATLGVAGQVSTYVQSVNSSDVASALIGCPAGETVLLNPGTYNLLSTLNISISNVTLRGAGPQQTILKWSTGASLNTCNGLGTTGLCITNGDSGIIQYSGNVLNVSSGLTLGSTSVTLGSAVNGSLSNLHVGSLLQFNQCDTGLSGSSCTGTNSDNGNDWDCGTGPSGSTATCTWGANTSSWPKRQHTQTVTVTGISGSTVTFTPGIYGSTWSSGQTPYAVFSSTLPVTGLGVENLQINTQGFGDMGTQVMTNWTTNSWFKNVAFINNDASGGSARVHLLATSSAHITTRDSYFYGSNPSANGYGADMAYGTCDSLTENNIYQHIASGEVLETGCGNVFGYAYDVDNYYGSGWQQCDAIHHGGGDEFNLWEGHEGICMTFDDDHGTGFAITHFRGYYSGHDPATLCPSSTVSCATTPKYGQTAAVILEAFNRYNNLMMNVLGDGVYATTYENVGLSGHTTTCGGFSWNVIISENFAYSGQGPFSPTCTSSPYTIDNDPLAGSTTALWGNYDTVTGTMRTNSGETASSAPVFPALASPSTSWSSYPSLYLATKPSWWGSMPWPGIGPEISGGDIPNVGGRAYHNPAEKCYASLGGRTDGSSGVLPFDANVCYPTGGTSTSGSLTITPSYYDFGNVTVGQTATHVITLQNTGTGSLTISGLSVAGSLFSVSSLITPYVLSPGGSVNVTVSFYSDHVSTYTGILTVADDSSSGNSTFNMSAAGVAGAAMPQQFKAILLISKMERMKSPFGR